MKYSNIEKDKEHFNVDTHEKLYLRLTAGSDWILPYIKEFWANVSRNCNSISFLEQNPDKIDWEWLSENPKAIHLL